MIIIYRISVSIEYIEKEIKSACSDCSTDDDNIPVQLIKLAASYIAPPLTNMLDTFIKKEKFQSKRKTLGTSPIHKVQTPTELSDYRQISILSVSCKIYEKIVMKQVVELSLERSTLLQRYTLNSELI